MPTVVDVHSHIWAEDWLPERFWDAFVDIAVRQNEKRGEEVDPERIRETYLPTYWDPDGEKLLERMDEAGIDRQVVFGVDFGLALGEPEVPIQEVNRRLAEFRDDNPDRIRAFATIDPRRRGAADHIETALSDWDMDGLKLHPTAGFYHHDPETYRLLEVVRRHDVPMLTDTGPIFAPLYSKYSHPKNLDEVLSDFPDLDIVAAHMSFEWWRDLHAVAVNKVNTNLYVDISGWQERCKHRPEEFATAVRRLMDAVGSDRMLFGTDDPAFDPVHPKEEWLENVRTLADRDEEPTFTETEIDRLLGQNALDLLA
ncbi:amidohydrolase family protein [Halococcus agarilyticus]|uniref:amidohydrolase family protein n=1 Tax=Halococcus agarilyticus TaxID=1232219 RepID=UPI000677E98E|nr:amidohydrolase family protein [Halococcus agarilyticus]